MAISVTCECGKKLTVKDEIAGKRAKCPDCQAVLTVPLAVSSNGQKKSNKMIWIAAGAGVLVLGFCCLSTVAIGGWFFFLRGPSLDPRLVGKWTTDVAAMKKANPKQFIVGSANIEFKSDGTVIDGSLTPIIKGNWKMISNKGDTVTVELSQSILGVSLSKQLEIKIVDSDHLKIAHPDTKQEWSFKRAT
jgi:hypothetical protein